MTTTRQRLYINIDHIATLRQQRRGMLPEPVYAALIAEAHGADGIAAQAFDISAYKIAADELVTGSGARILFHAMAWA